MFFRATKFEFEQRFWFIGAILWIGFSLYGFDKVNFAVATLGLFPSIPQDGPAAAHFVQGMFGLGAALLFAAAMLRTWATAYLRTGVVHDSKQHSEALVADGPFRYVRNPLYLANLPMAAGIGMMASRAGFVFLIAAIWIFMYRLILREEYALLRTQGEAYRAYSQKVPRFWPSPTPRVPSGGTAPRWGQAIAGELFMWLFGISMLALAITLNMKLTLIGFGCSLAIYFIGVSLAKKSAGA